MDTSGPTTNYLEPWDGTEMIERPNLSLLVTLAATVSVLIGPASANERFAADVVRAHAQRVLETSAAGEPDSGVCDQLLLNPVPYNFGLVVPVLGTVLLERRAFGEIRRNGVLGDWILGGAIPAVLAIAGGIAYAADNRSAGRVLIGSSVGIYICSRILVYPPANNHIYTFNKYIRQHCFR